MVKSRGSVKKTRKRSTNVRLICDLAGQVVEGRKIKPHYNEAILCSNGSLTTWCAAHQTRTFIGKVWSDKILEEKGDFKNGRS